MAATTPSTTISTIVLIMSSLVHSLFGRSVEAPVFEFFDDRVQVEGNADARRGPVVHADGVREPAGEQHALPGGGRAGDALAGSRSENSVACVATSMIGVIKSLRAGPAHSNMDMSWGEDQPTTSWSASAGWEASRSRIARRSSLLMRSWSGTVKTSSGVEKIG